MPDKNVAIIDGGGANIVRRQNHEAVARGPLRQRTVDAVRRAVPEVFRGWVSAMEKR